MQQFSNPRGKPTVLLIDDCGAERALYEIALEPDFHTLTAARGWEGMSLAQRAHPDAIVLDVMMPGMDGWETCTLIKSDAVTTEIPVILLTAADDRDLTQHAVAVGATALLRKPCAPEQLRETIISALQADRRV